METQGVAAKDAKKVQAMFPDLDGYSATCRPGSWEYHDGRGAQMRGALKVLGYKETDDPAASWRSRWVKESKGRHAWGKDDTCVRCRLYRTRYAWGWLYSRDGQAVEGEQAPDRDFPDGRSVAVYRVPPCPSANKSVPPERGSVLLDDANAANGSLVGEAAGGGRA